MGNGANLLSSVKPEECFVLKNGRILKNLYELTNSLTSIDAETFRHHVNDEKNDFANWIRYVYNDEELAEHVARAKTPDAIIKRINGRLAKLSKSSSEGGKFRLFSRPNKQKDRKQIAQDKPQNIAETRSDGREIIRRLDELLLKEKELEKREDKIQEIEERIEKKLAEQKQPNSEAKFFSKEFVQGLVTGFLITLIGVLIYMKFMA